MMIEPTAVRWLLTALFAAAALGAALPAARAGGISVAGGRDGGSVLHGGVRGFGRHHLAALWPPPAAHEDPGWAPLRP